VTRFRSSAIAPAAANGFVVTGARVSRANEVIMNIHSLWRYPVAVALVFLMLLAGARAAELRIATCQFPISDNVAANAEWIRKQMQEAKAQGAEIVHFPETALSGYGGVDHASLAGFPWARQREELEKIFALARELRVWVVLGANHPLTGDHKPHNSLYVIDPAGKIVDRYDKRFCTTGDLKHYSPGDHFVTFEVNGVRCGLLICYDIRFPELYREYAKLGVQVMFHSFYNARQKEGSIHPKIMPPTAQAYAGTNHMYISLNNSSAPRSWESRFITPDGLIVRALELDQPGVMVNVVDTAKKFYDASGPFRADAIRGKLNSGDVVSDPRSRDRKSY
jgi:predicted amidohydrolase